MVEDEEVLLQRFVAGGDVEATPGERAYRAGDTEDIEVTVRPSGDSWLIDNM